MGSFLLATDPLLAQPTSCNVFVDQDSYLKEASPSENHGTDSELSLKNSGSSDDLRPVYRYDLSGFSSVASASSWFLVTGDDAAATVEVHRITDSLT